MAAHTVGSWISSSSSSSGGGVIKIRQAQADRGHLCGGGLHPLTSQSRKSPPCLLLLTSSSPRFPPPFICQTLLDVLPLPTFTHAPHTQVSHMLAPTALLLWPPCLNEVCELVFIKTGAFQRPLWATLALKTPPRFSH